MYLMLALAGSVVGSIFVWFRNRKPTSVESGIDEFNRGLQALDPRGAPQSSWWRNNRRDQRD